MATKRRLPEDARPQGLESTPTQGSQVGSDNVGEIRILDGKYMCGPCKLQFEEVSPFKDHLVAHVFDTLYQCYYCPALTQDTAGLSKHIERQHPNRNVYFACLLFPTADEILTSLQVNDEVTTNPSPGRQVWLSDTSSSPGTPKSAGLREASRTLCGQTKVNQEHTRENTQEIIGHEPRPSERSNVQTTDTGTMAKASSSDQDLLINLHCVFERNMYHCKTCTLASKSSWEFSKHAHDHFHKKDGGLRCSTCPPNQGVPVIPSSCHLVRKLMGILDKQKEAQKLARQLVPALQGLIPAHLIKTIQPSASDSSQPPRIVPMPANTRPIASISVPTTQPNVSQTQDALPSNSTISSPNSSNDRPDISVPTTQPNRSQTQDVLPFNSTISSPNSSNDRPDIPVPTTQSNRSQTQDALPSNSTISSPNSSNDRPHALRPLQNNSNPQSQPQESSTPRNTTVTPVSSNSSTDALRQLQNNPEPSTNSLKITPLKSVLRCHYADGQFFCDCCKYAVPDTKPKIFRKHLWFEMHPGRSCDHNPQSSMYNRFISCPLINQLMAYLLACKTRSHPKQTQHGEKEIAPESNSENHAPLSTSGVSPGENCNPRPSENEPLSTSGVSPEENCEPRPSENEPLSTSGVSPEENCEPRPSECAITNVQPNQGPTGSGTIEEESSRSSDGGDGGTQHCSPSEAYCGEEGESVIPNPSGVHAEEPQQFPPSPEVSLFPAQSQPQPLFNEERSNEPTAMPTDGNLCDTLMSNGQSWDFNQPTCDFNPGRTKERPPIEMGKVGSTGAPPLNLSHPATPLFAETNEDIESVMETRARLALQDQHSVESNSHVYSAECAGSFHTSTGTSLAEDNMTLPLTMVEREIPTDGGHTATSDWYVNTTNGSGIEFEEDRCVVEAPLDLSRPASPIPAERDQDTDSLAQIHSSPPLDLSAKTSDPTSQLCSLDLNIKQGNSEETTTPSSVVDEITPLDECGEGIVHLDGMPLDLSRPGSPVSPGSRTNNYNTMPVLTPIPKNYTSSSPSHASERISVSSGEKGQSRSDVLLPLTTEEIVRVLQSDNGTRRDEGTLIRPTELSPPDLTKSTTDKPVDYSKDAALSDCTEEIEDAAYEENIASPSIDNPRPDETETDGREGGSLDESGGEGSSHEQNVARTLPYVWNRSRKVRMPASPSIDDRSRQVYVCAFFKCPNFVSKEPTSFKIHNMVQHHKTEKFPCAFCPLEFATEDDLIIHTDQSHTDRREVLHFRTYHCGFKHCWMTTNKTEEFENHNNTRHVNAVAYPCCFCRRKFPGLRRLLLHIVESVTYSCSLCPEIQGTTDELIKEHLFTTHSTQMSPRGTGESLIRLHLKCVSFVEDGEVKYQCIKRHVKLSESSRVTLENQDSFKCRNCSLVTCNESFFEGHVIKCMQKSMTATSEVVREHPGENAQTDRKTTLVGENGGSATKDVPPVGTIEGDVSMTLKYILDTVIMNVFNEGVKHDSTKKNTTRENGARCDAQVAKCSEECIQRNVENGHEKTSQRVGDGLPPEEKTMRTQRLGDADAGRPLGSEEVSSQHLPGSGKQRPKIHWSPETAGPEGSDCMTDSASDENPLTIFTSDRELTMTHGGEKLTSDGNRPHTAVIDNEDTVPTKEKRVQGAGQTGRLTGNKDVEREKPNSVNDYNESLQPTVSPIIEQPCTLKELPGTNRVILSEDATEGTKGNSPSDSSMESHFDKEDCDQVTDKAGDKSTTVSSETQGLQESLTNLLPPSNCEKDCTRGNGDNTPAVVIEGNDNTPVVVIERNRLLSSQNSDIHWTESIGKEAESTLTECDSTTNETIRVTHRGASQFIPTYQEQDSVMGDLRVFDEGHTSTCQNDVNSNQDVGPFNENPVLDPVPTEKASPKQTESFVKKLILDNIGAPLRCDQCSFTTGLRAVKAIHERVHTLEQDKDNTLWCAHCPYSCDSVLHFQIHTQCHAERARIRIYHCAHCSHSFNQMDNIEDHHEDVHGNLKVKYEVTKLDLDELECPLCASTVSKELELLLHMEEIHGSSFVKAFLEMMYGIEGLDSVEGERALEGGARSDLQEKREKSERRDLVGGEEGVKVLASSESTQKEKQSADDFNSGKEKCQNLEDQKETEVRAADTSSCLDEDGKNQYSDVCNTHNASEPEDAGEKAKGKHVVNEIADSIFDTKTQESSTQQNPPVEPLTDKVGHSDDTASNEDEKGMWVSQESLQLLQDMLEILEDVSGKSDKAKSTYDCPICPYASIHKVDISKHLRNHMKPIERGFKCAYCPYACLVMHNVTLHIKRFHPDLPMREIAFGRKCDKKVETQENGENGIAPQEDRSKEDSTANTTERTGHMDEAVNKTKERDNYAALHETTQGNGSPRDQGTAYSSRVDGKNLFKCKRCVYMNKSDSKIHDHFLSRHISPDADEIQKTPNKTDSSPKTTDDIKTIQVGSEKLRGESSEAKSDSSSSASCARVSEIPASPRPAEECTELIYTERIGVCQEKYLGAALEVATLKANRSCTGKDRPQDCSSSVTDSSSETLEYERCSEELSDSEVCETLQEKLPEAELEVDPTTRDALSAQAEECSSSITDSCSDTVEYDLSDSTLDYVEPQEIKRSPKKALIPGKHTKVLNCATSSPQHPKRELRQKEPSSSTPSLPCHMNTRQNPIEKEVQDVEEHAVADSDVSECDQESIAEPCDVGTDGTEYECKYCPYTTAVRQNVELHVRKHISYRPMQCSYCSFTATLAGDVKEHINGTHPERPVVIKRNRIAAIEASIGKHFMQKSSVKRYPKRTRSVSIERYQLNRDQLGKESSKKIDKEGVTSQNKRKVTDDGKRPRKFQKGKSGSRALCPRVEKESIRCRLCTLEMPSDAYLEDHMATFHKDYTGFKCTYCGVHIRFKKKMLSHLNKKHPSGELKYRRIVNGVQLKEMSKTARKIAKAKKIGKVRKSGNARKAGKTGKGKKTGKLSKQSKQGEPSKERTPISARDVGNTVKFSCKHCPYTSTNRQHIKEHVMVHMDYRPYTSGHCPFVAIRKQYITLHSEKKHPGLKPVVTRIPHKTKESSLTQHFTSDPSCDKELSKKNLLNKTQLRIRKKYRASSQRRKQSKMSKVKRHSTTESTDNRGRKMLSCKHCSYTSTIPRLMKQHVMNHINYKPFKCRHCDYRSVRSDSVKDHSISKHPEKPVKVLITRDAGIEASLSKLFCEKLEMHTEKAIEKQPTQNLNLLTLGKTQQVKRQLQNEKAVEEQLSASQDLPPTLEKVQKVSRQEQSGHVSVGKKHPSKVIMSSSDRRETSVEKQLSASQDLPPTLEKVQETSASFVCKHCPHEAVTEHEIKDHVMSHTQYKPFQCLHCSYQATRPSHVRAHSRRNHPNKMHGMKGGLNTEPLLENHYTRKEGSNVETPQKGDSFKRKRRAHEESSPSKRAKLPEKGTAQNSSENKRAEAECYKCVKCGAKYSSRATALRHIMSELNFLPWSCPHCTFKDDTLVIVKKHCSEHHPTKPFKVVFNHVDMTRVKTLISQSKMKQASESGTTSGEVDRGNSQKYRPSVPHVFHCEHCPYQSQVKVCFQKHTLLHGSQRFQCGYCPHRAFFKCDVKRHIATRHKKKPCKVISLRSQEILTKKETTRVKKHNSSQADSSNTRSSVHGRSKDRSKTSKVNVLRRSPKKRRQRNPKEVNLYGCEECPFQSLDRASFQMHILIHKPKRFQCGYCRYSEYFKYQIVNHMRKLHKTKPHRIILLENGPSEPVEGEDSSDDIIENFPREEGGILAELEAELEEMARGDYQGVESDVPSSIKKEDMSQLFKSALTSEAIVLLCDEITLTGGRPTLKGAGQPQQFPLDRSASRFQERWRCNWCDMECRCLYESKRHIRKMHPGLPAQTSRIPPDSYPPPAAGNGGDTQDAAFSMSEKDMVYARQRAFSKGHESNSIKFPMVFCCFYCSYKTDNSTELVRHQKVHA